jgi:hypothetical protein
MSDDDDLYHGVPADRRPSSPYPADDEALRASNEPAARLVPVCAFNVCRSTRRAGLAVPAPADTDPLRSIFGRPRLRGSGEARTTTPLAAFYGAALRRPTNTNYGRAPL